MLVLGHAGITLGASIIISGFLPEKNTPAIETNRHSNSSGVPDSLSHPCNNRARFLSRRLNVLADYIDIRLLFIGSLLPDLIDKPVGMLFFRESLSNGRIFCHTLLFLIVISLTGLFIYRKYSKSWLLVLSFGTFMHLILDAMWTQPKTFLWPALGFTFDKRLLYNWWANIINGLLTNPEVFIPELIGTLILAWFLFVLIRRKKLGAFILHGEV